MNDNYVDPCEKFTPDFDPNECVHDYIRVGNDIFTCRICRTRASLEEDEFLFSIIARLQDIVKDKNRALNESESDRNNLQNLCDKQAVDLYEAQMVEKGLRHDIGVCCDELRNMNECIEIICYVDKNVVFDCLPCGDEIQEKIEKILFRNKQEYL